MYFKNISERQVIDFTQELLNYYSQIDNSSNNFILTHSDAQSVRNNTGWYQHVDSQHEVFINVPNILCAQLAIKKGLIDYDSFYALVSLCVGHEFRHFLQGRVLYDNHNIKDYSQESAFNSELMLYIHYFFDAYYLLNKGNVEYEVDAERFSIINGIKYLNSKYPWIDAERSMLEAINFLAYIQSQGGIVPTLPLGCYSIDEVLQKLQNKITLNERISELDKTLFVYDPRFYQVHDYYGLDEDEVITKSLLQEYINEKKGNLKDLLVVKRILSLLDYPEQSLEDFPKLRKRYKENTL